MTNTTDTPTVVLVHGGFADASFWVPVIRELQASDLPVIAPANPLRGLAHDAEYVASVVRQIDGPVLLVGHSYGGAVISVAGAAAPNAVGLVYVAAFALDEGESFAEIFERFGPTPLMDRVREHCADRDPDSVHFEWFSADPSPQLTESQTGEFDIVLRRRGARARPAAAGRARG